MKLKNITAETRVTSLGMPLFYKGSSKNAVLLIHGFTGIADEMKYLATRLNEAGFSVSVPRLPGHGTNGQDFMQTNRHDWLRRAVDAYIELKSQYEKVYVAGLSMGGVLTLLLASHFPIERIALGAPAIVLKNRLIYFSPILRFFLPRKYVGHEEESDNPERQFISEQYWSYRYGHQIYNLFLLQKAALRELPKVTSSTLTIVSHTDDAVPVKAADIIESKISSPRTKRVELEESSHIVVNDTDKERVADEIIKWFSSD